MLNVLRRLPQSKYVLVGALLLFYLGIGAFYAGEQFLLNISAAIPTQPSGGGDAPHFMLCGDHFQQLYRYSLPGHNLKNGRPLYESGYQYNFASDGKPFSEGWMFFPFSLLHLVLATVFGDVASYNLIALLSFPLVGGAMYLLVFWLTRSHPAALLSSLVLALLPHRTSFLFGEMVYGVDLMWPPLIVLFFEKTLRTLAPLNILLFGLCLLLYTTSNFQAFFLFAFFSLPYFVGRSIQVSIQSDFPMASKFRAVGFVLIALLPALLYLLYIGNLIGASGLSSGQSYLETQFYSALPSNVIQVWSGNEKSVYIGLPLLIAAFLIIVLCGRRCLKPFSHKLQRPESSILVLSGAVFVISYLFCFGPNLDEILNVKIYRWYFEHIPGANSIRTPGRLMGTAGFYFSLFFGLTVYRSTAVWETEKTYKSVLVFVITGIMAVLIIYNYRYTRPFMVKLEAHNEAYEKIRGAQGIIYTIPTQPQAGNHLNGTFLYYAQKYDLRMFTGHSSMYPREWNSIIHDFLPINTGSFDRKMMERFQAWGITHLVAHATTFEPKVAPLVIALLKQSPYLDLIEEAKGVYVFHVNVDASGSQSLDIEGLLADIQVTGEEIGKFHFLDGWYSREVYPGKRPFRWMHGTDGNGVVFGGERVLETMEIEYQCPQRQGLAITINGTVVQSKPTDIGMGWKKYVIDLRKYGRRTYFYVEFFTPQVFKSPPDVREFGCMVGDIFVR